jgi:hypothetical protein
MKRPKPSDLYLQQMGGHIGYEVDSAVSGLLRWVRNGDALAGEAGLLHLRALIEFLVGRQDRNSEDVSPNDWVEDWKVDDPVANYFRAEMAAIDRYLSHLSLARAADTHPAEMPAGPERRFSETLDGLLNLAGRFLAAAKSPDLAPVDRAIEGSRESLRELWGRLDNPLS